MAQPQNPQSELELEKFRPYLVLLAQVTWGPGMQGKLDASDLVQETLLAAHRKRSQFRGQSEAEMAAWLRQMLAMEIADARRGFRRGKRDIARERSLHATLDGSASGLEALAAEQSSPSQRAVGHELLLLLAQAILQLPDDQRRAVEWKHLQGLSVGTIAGLMNRSETAVGGLLRRGMMRLRELLIEQQGHSHDE
jgi:RNA polymerase sigma-70 factor, ECF subfamily